MRGFLVGLSRPRKVALALLADAVMLPFALWLALSLRYGTFWFEPGIVNLAVFLAGTVSGIGALWGFGLYKWMIRYLSGRTFLGILQAAVVSGLAVGTAIMFLRAELPRSTPIIYAIIVFSLVGLSRWLGQHYLRAPRRHMRIPVIVYGAGSSGLQLALALHNSSEYKPVAFVDDKAPLQGMMVYGLRVHPPGQLKTLIDEFQAEQILLAMPSASISRRREILLGLEPLSIKVRTVPGMADMVSGKARVDEIRDIDIEDLLGRDPVPPQPALLGRTIIGKSVMVTGAGGSIGSELCRQILALGPQRLVLFEVSEYALYSIEAELRGRRASQPHLADVELVAVLGSVQKQDLMQSVMTRFGVKTVFHAAAYKHVPLVEQNVVEGVRNNVFGTLAAVNAACAAQADTFVLISTDKAVRPTNVMGASKRMAELVLQARAQAGAITRLCMVRFGNVLGSSGSVVPLFKEQIRRGGPVTVTHPEIIRYFMTIPEAAQLVIQAGAMAEGGDVFLLDMGDAVKIAELARRMIHLMGHEVKSADAPQGIEVVYTGLRPGEKLYEELLISAEASRTDHPRIMRAKEGFLEWPQLQEVLDRLAAASEGNGAEEVVAILRAADLGFAPAVETKPIVADPPAVH